MDSLEIDGKEFVSARRAAREYGYTSDYIGQLVRKGLIVGKKVGRAWYVGQESLLAYARSLAADREALSVSMSTPKVVETMGAIEQKKQEETVAPTLLSIEKNEESVKHSEIEKKPYEYLSVRQPNREVEAQKVAMHEVYSMKYLPDDESVFPSVETRRQEAEVKSEQQAAKQVSIRTMLGDMKEEGFSTTSIRHPAQASSYAPPSRALHLLGSLAGTVAVLVLILSIASTAFLSRTLVFDGKEISAGVSFYNLEY